MTDAYIGDIADGGEGHVDDEIEVERGGASFRIKLSRAQPPKRSAKVFADSPYTVVMADKNALIRVDATGGAVVLNLTAIATLGDFMVQVAKVDASANTVTINRGAADTINGSASYVLGSQYEAVTLAAKAGVAAWLAIGRAGVSGPGASTANSVALWSNTTGQVLKDGPALGTSGHPLKSAGAGAPPTFGQIAWTVGISAGTQGQVPYWGAAGAAAALAVGTADHVLTSKGAAQNPAWQGIGAVLDALIGSTRGMTLYRGAGGWAARAPNTAGFVMTDGGAGADPNWAAPANPAGMTLISDSGALGSVANWTLDGIASNYIHLMMVVDLVPATDAVYAQMHLRKAGPANLADYSFTSVFNFGAGDTASFSDTTDPIILMSDLVQNDAASGGYAAIVWVLNIQSARQKRVSAIWNHLDGSVEKMGVTAARGVDTATVTGLLWQFSSGNIASGRIRVWGM